MLAASIIIFILYFCLLVYYVLSIITSIVMLYREHLSFQDCWCAAYSSEHEVQNLSPEKYSAYCSINELLQENSAYSSSLYHLLLLLQTMNLELL